jgi:hypothetical protein
MLHVQIYLTRFEHRGPEQLKEELGIEYRRKDGKVIFSYSQYDSPKLDPIVKECRGLILYEKQWDVCSYAFERFFNLGESGAEDLRDLKDCHVLPKLDGTMCNLYWDRQDESYHVSTRSMVDADGPVNDLESKSFSQLFWEAAPEGFRDRINEWHTNRSKARLGELTLTFELTSPLNRIVTPYPTSSITLLLIRQLADTYDEVSLEGIKRIGTELGVKYIEPVKFTDWEELLKMQGLASTDEGFVVLRESKQGSHKRVKVKNPAYLSIARTLTGVSEKHFVELIKSGKADDFIGLYPEYRDKIEKLVEGVGKLSRRITQDYLKIQGIPERKDFAIQATTTRFPGMMFGLRDKKITKLGDDLLLLPTDKLLDMIHSVLKEEGNNG